MMRLHLDGLWVRDKHQFVHYISNGRAMVVTRHKYFTMQQSTSSTPVKWRHEGVFAATPQNYETVYVEYATEDEMLTAENDLDRLAAIMIAKAALT